MWDVDPNLAEAPNRGRMFAARGLEAGWLCFAAGETKLRLLPVPEGWEKFTEEKLNLLRRVAQPGLTPAV